jgi:hypothetical protein
MGFMLLSLIISGYTFYRKDRHDLAFFSVPKNKKKFYDDIRKKLNEFSKDNKTITMNFTNLYSKIYLVFFNYYIKFIILVQF